MGNPFGKLQPQRNIPHESLDLKQTPQLNNLDLEDDDEDLRARVFDDGEFFDDPLETKLIEDALISIYSSNNDETHVKFELTAGESSSSSSSSIKNPSKQQNESGFLKYQCKPFLGQKIDEIRAKANSGCQFIDPYFKPSIKLITESCRTELFKSLANALRVANKFDMNELAQRIVWKKSKVK